MTEFFVGVLIVFNILYPVENEVASLPIGYEAFIQLQRLAETAYYFDADNKECTPVLVYTFEGAVIDIYTSAKRQELK